MHTYRKSEPGLWTVGFDVSTPDANDFQPLKDFNTEEGAAAYVSYLNGGESPRKPWPSAGL